jgi:hypothetical protein
MKLINKTVKLQLVGQDGNAFSLMGAFKRAATRQGWKDWEIEKVLTICMTSDYNNLLATLMDHCEDICGKEDDNEDDED